MLSFLPSFIKGPLAALLVTINTLFWFMPLMLVAMLKVLIRIPAWQRACAHALTWIAERWISINTGVDRLTQNIEWDVRLPADLDRGGSYVVIANHQSWADIFILQRAFNRRIPFLKFFLKQQLIWVPFLGVAWWALDMPFMKRYSRDYLERYPEKRGTDLEVTRRACEKFRDMPVSVMNFVEGTRFRLHKHGAQDSPYRHLLKPRAGGLAFVLNSMNGSIRTLLDVTIVYRPHRAGFWDLLSGRVDKVIMRVREIGIPERFLRGDYQNDLTWREDFQAWVRELWAEKDRQIEALLDAG